MTGINDVVLQNVIVHKVGNPSRGEELRLSENSLALTDEIIRGLLTKYFLGSFNENELYHFSHISDLTLNEAFTYVGVMFNDKQRFVEQSVFLAQFLYSKSTHVKVKEGELYVVYFERVPFEGDFIDAVGIFKSESKETFIKVLSEGQNWEVHHEEGVNINKLDKGCLIFKSSPEEGYKMCIVDNTNKQQDAQYWINDFLQVKPYADSYHHTNNYLSLYKNFVTNEYPEKFEVSKSEQIDLLNRSMDYFKSKEQFSLKEFAEEVMHHQEVVDTFMDYKKNFESSRNFEIDEEFDIHLSAVKKQQRVYKSVLKLDRNFHIYIHGRRDLMERGYDEATGKQYYKLYFEEEH